jgi:hypothetical protein
VLQQLAEVGVWRCDEDVGRTLFYEESLGHYPELVVSNDGVESVGIVKTVQSLNFFLPRIRTLPRRVEVRHMSCFSPTKSLFEVSSSSS